MINRNLYLLITVAVFLAVQVCMAGYYFLRSRRSSRASWEDLLGKLMSTDKDNISQIALSLVDGADEDDQASLLEPSQLWGLVGGLEGLQVLEKNSEVLIDLAFYVQQWYPEAVVIAERLRLDARELKWHIARLRGAAQTGNLQVSFPFYAQRAVVAYYRMTRRLLSLYEASNLVLLADLQRAL